MSCFIFHKWKPHYRKHEPKEVVDPGFMLSSFVFGYPLVVKNVPTYMATETYLYDRCTRCGKKRT